MKISKKTCLFLGLIVSGLFWGIITSFPDGKLHIFFCDVGQGDAIYIRMPNQTDLLVDGGPNDKVLSCLSRHMAFYDRKIDLVVLTHPQKDHLEGLITALERYTINYFITVPVANTTQSYQVLIQKLKDMRVNIAYLTTDDKIRFDDVTAKVIWPQKNWLIETLKMNSEQEDRLNKFTNSGNLLGISTNLDLNIFSLYLSISYKNFSLLLTGDGDRQTQAEILSLGLESIIPAIAVLKVPHHGSATALRTDFIEILHPLLSVIEVGKNNYGHPNKDTINLLSKFGQVMRTDQSGDIEVITDGLKFSIK